MLADELAYQLDECNWRFSLSLSAPTLLAELVRKYAIADVRVFVGLAKAPP